MPDTRIKIICLLVLLVLSLRPAHAQGTVPTFQRVIGSSYTLAGRDPAQSGTTVIPTVLVPITLTFDGKKHVLMDPTPDVPRILKSPIYSRFAFAVGGKTQYADGLLHSTFPSDTSGHTLLGKPEIKPVTIAIPQGYGYILSSKKNGGLFAVVDIEFLEKQLFQQIPRQDGKLVIAVTHNTTYYTDSDATVCCSWGTHGVDAATGNSFVLGSYLRATPAIVEDRDIQPLTQQLAEFINDPLHDPHTYFRTTAAAGNFFPAWMRPGEARGCAGAGIGSNYFLLEPTNTNATNSFPVSKPFFARTAGFTYHLQNVATLRWYLGTAVSSTSAYSFPDPNALTEPAQPCPARGMRLAGNTEPSVTPIPTSASLNNHRLIGYWTGSSFTGVPFPLRDVSPQWDVIIVAFAAPDPSAPEGTLQFRTPRGIDPDQVKTDIAYLKSQGKKVMISLGGGGKYFKLDDPQNIPNFVSSVTSIVSEYGFDGVDIDFETPSLALVPGDTDFQHPTTPSVVNLITGLRQLQRSLRLRIHDQPGSGRDSDPRRVPQLRWPIRLLPAARLWPARYPLFHRRAGLQHPAARRSRRRNLSVQLRRLSRRHDGTPAAWLQCRRESPAILSAHARQQSRCRLSHGIHIARNRKPGNGLHHYRQSSRRNHLQATQALRLSRYDRSHVLDHRCRPPRQLQILQFDWPTTPQLFKN